MKLSEQVRGSIRIVCNSDIRQQDIEAASAAAREQAQRLSFFKHDPEEPAQSGTERLEFARAPPARGSERAA